MENEEKTEEQTAEGTTFQQVVKEMVKQSPDIDGVVTSIIWRDELDKTKLTPGFISVDGNGQVNIPMLKRAAEALTRMNITVVLEGITAMQQRIEQLENALASKESEDGGGEGTDQEAADPE